MRPGPTPFGSPRPAPILPAPVRPAPIQASPAPIVPRPATPAAVQPHAGHAFALPANFALKPRGSGQPLPEPIQKKMESFFKTSFADVRVHVGPEAPSIGALAFTHGTDLYFAPGQYNPESSRGQQLLGHELTHVVQQRAGRVRNPLGSGVAVVQDPALEAEAERMGLHAASTAMPIQAKPSGVGPVVATVPAAGLGPNAVAANGAILPALAPSPAAVQRRSGPILAATPRAVPGNPAAGAGHMGPPPRIAPVRPNPPRAGQSAGTGGASSPHPIQMSKPDGLYRVRTDANLRRPRDRDGNYAVIRKLPAGTVVRALSGDAPGPSNFKAGWFRENEHTWVEVVPDPAIEYEYRDIGRWESGWVEDGNLETDAAFLQSQWQAGDKLYGRHETRDSIRRLNYGYNSNVRRSRYNIVDDINDQMTEQRPDEYSDEVRAFHTHLSSTYRDPARVRIRKLCKLGLAYYTQANTVHFMLDGLVPKRVVLEAAHSRDDDVSRQLIGEIGELEGEEGEGVEKKCTGAEMRALMRQRLHDLRRPGGKGLGINLANVRFYLYFRPVGAPWSSDAPSDWKGVWNWYARYRAGRADAL